MDPVPMIVFPKGANQSLDAVCNLGYNVVGLDWLIDPAEAIKIKGNRPIVFQGNADPGVLYGTDASISETVEEMAKGFGGGKGGWIANLGHGKLKNYNSFSRLIKSVCLPKSNTNTSL